MKNLILAILVFGFLYSCQKDDVESLNTDPELPLITQTGENTFGCFANGILITPRDGSGTFGFPDPGLIFRGSPDTRNYNEIDVHDFASARTSKVILHIENLKTQGIGIYPIMDSNCYMGLDGPQETHVFCRIWVEEDQIYKSYCSVANTGTIEITRYDFENRIVSGIFSCSSVSFDDPDDIIEITQGRFDIDWDKLPANFP